MTVYVIAGLAVLWGVSLVISVIFSYRSGRTTARLQSTQRDERDASHTAHVTQHMLDARTNGLRNDQELISSLDKGEF